MTKTTEIEEAIEQFAAAQAGGTHREVNIAHSELIKAIHRNKHRIPALAALPDLSIPGLSIEVWICMRCGRYRVEHNVAALSGWKDACDAFTREDLSEQDGAQPSAIEALRSLLSTMTGTGSDWDDKAAKHREDADLAEDDEDWQESLSKPDRISYEQDEEDAALDIMNSQLPSWIKQLESAVARLDLTKEL